MPQFKVTILAFRKGNMLDPEAGPILNCLIRMGHIICQGLRKAKLIRFQMESKDMETAQTEAEKICKNTNIINQVSEVASATVEIVE
jgi:phosphoribosylformylglycinamidine (FGAM) synthase PurS component